jgi:hypothetical protein
MSSLAEDNNIKKSLHTGQDDSVEMGLLQNKSDNKFEGMMVPGKSNPFSAKSRLEQPRNTMPSEYPSNHPIHML